MVQYEGGDTYNFRFNHFLCRFLCAGGLGYQALVSLKAKINDLELRGIYFA